MSALQVVIEGVHVGIYVIAIGRSALAQAILLCGQQCSAVEGLLVVFGETRGTLEQTEIALSESCGKKVKTIHTLYF